MDLIVKYPYINDTYQRIMVNEFKKVHNQILMLSTDYVRKNLKRMTPNRMSQFISLIVFQFAFGLTKSGTMTLLSSDKANIVKNYIASMDKTFPGGSTVIKRTQSILDECEEEIISIAERVQDGFYVSVGTQARDAFAAEYTSKRVSMTPPVECFIGLLAPSKLFPDLTVEERGLLIPFFNARVYMRAKRISGTPELVGELKTPSFEGATIFPLASKLGFFGGPPRVNAFYGAFKDLENMGLAIDKILNDKLADLELSDLSVVSVDGTNVPVDKRDSTGSIGTGSRGTFFGHKSSIACDAQCFPFHCELDTGHRSDLKMFSDTIAPVKDLADRSGRDIWCVVADAAYSDGSLISEVEAMNAVPIVDINPKNSALLKELKEKGIELRRFTKKALKAASRDLKRKLREKLRSISQNRGSTILVEEKKSILGGLMRLVGERILLKGLSAGELQTAGQLRNDLMAIRRKIRASGTSYEKKVGLAALAYGTIEWLLVYSIRGQNEGINGLLKKRGDLIGDGQHTSWLIGRDKLSGRQTMDSIGIKHVAVVKFIVTGQKDHHLRAIHNWRHSKRFFCVCLLVFFCR
ncbi:MAG: transposase [Candidatus Lokiarchaeota archaeon]|nr:transposase [Candidatus Lokiarchaeota archaeon]MBD3340203.1 transposase [Candidatus Lokiarchaeota archaeon]